MTRETDELARLRLRYAEALAAPVADPVTDEDPPCKGMDWEHEANQARRMKDGETECLPCLKGAVISLADYCREPIGLADEDDADICERCGHYGTMKHGDPDDCRSPDCMAEKCDRAMDAVRDALYDR